MIYTNVTLRSKKCKQDSKYKINLSFKMAYFCTMSVYHQVILSLGSNMGDRKDFLQQAIDLLHQRLGLIAKISSIFETPAWGFESDPFYNIALLLHTHHSPEYVLNVCLDIENELGRIRPQEEGYVARVIDIDVLFYNDEILKKEHLTLPHPILHQRAFVLIPLEEIAPDYKHPELYKTVRQMVADLNSGDTITKVDQLVNPKSVYDFSTINFLSIEGNIGAGKTTLTQKISNDFNAKAVLERFADNPFLPKFYEDQTRYAFPLEMSFLADRYSQLTDDLSQYNLFTDFVVADYYIFKSLIFAQVTLEADEVRLYRNIFDIMYKDAVKPNLYIYLYQNTDRLLQNIVKRGREYEQNIPADYLENINTGYKEFIKSLPENEVLVIDISEKDFVANHQDYLDILDLIFEKLKKGAS